jgi:YihY family inner membrane protein
MILLRPIPQTHQFASDSAWRLIREAGVRTLVRDSYRRLRQADGLTHARSLAFVTVLVMIQAGVGLVGLASVAHSGTITNVVVRALDRVVPGPAGHVLGVAVSQANLSASRHHYVALIIGAGGALVTTTTAMGQVESGLNRLYGIASDRPWLQRYALSALFAVGVGSLVAVSFVCLTFGRDLLMASNGGVVVSGWDVVRWPLGLVLLGCAVTVVFRWTPRRRQPRLSWLALGASIVVLGWATVTSALGWFYSSSSSFGSTYGPLAGFIALLAWCFLSSLTLFFGGAVCAQLEAMRFAHAAQLVDEEPDNEFNGLAHSGARVSIDRWRPNVVSE